jgi:hypothetical protein
VTDRPKARTEGVITEQVDDELVVYDRLSQTAHCLSADAASVWELCDGHLSEAEIAQRLEILPEEVQRAIDALSERGLLEEAPVTAPQVRAYSRRQATVRLAKAGGAAFAAPLIYSAVVGSVAAAASPGSLPVAGNYTGCPAFPVGSLMPGTVLGSGGPTGANSSTGCSNACGQTPQNCTNWTAPTCRYGLCYQTTPISDCLACDLTGLGGSTCCVCGNPLCLGSTVTYACATQYNCRLDGQPCPGRTDMCGPSPSGASNGATCAPPTDGTVTRLCCTADGTATGAAVACSRTTGPNFGCCGGFCQSGVCAPCPSAAACAPR